MAESKFKFKSKVKDLRDALAYIDARRKGLIKSLRTPWQKLNDAGIDGIEWGNCVVFGARPSNFKTTIKDQIINNAHRLNPDQDFDVIDIRLELSGRRLANREFSSILGKSIKDICSARVPLSDADFQRLLSYAESVRTSGNAKKFKSMDEGCTVHEFIDMMEAYFEANTTIISIPDPKDSSKTIEKKIYRKALIAIDHTRLFDSRDMDGDIDLLFKYVIKSKRNYDCIYVILSQLNKDCEKTERRQPGVIGNYKTTGDLYGSDSASQAADMIILLDVPAKSGITIYGPDKYIVDDPHLLVWNFVKNRDDDPQLSFFRADGRTMTIHEREAPPMAQSIGKR